MSKLRAWRRGLLPKVAPLVAFLAGCIGRTLRIQTEGWERYRDHQGPLIFAGWHGRSFVATTFFRGKGLWIIVSNSRDGEMQTRIFQRFGFQTIRGSTGREGVKAAIEGIRALKAGGWMALTPDGPRGPSGILQPGILMMAQKSGALIVPVGIDAKRRWIAKSWDQYMIPKPFSPVRMLFGDPISVPTEMTPEEHEAIRLQVEQALHAIERRAAQHDASGA